MDAQESPTSTADFVLRLQGKGVTIWAEDGRVCYRAVKGVLTQQEINALRRRKREITEYLQKSDPQTTEPPLVPQLDPNPVPLTFSQQWLWNAQGRQTRSFRTVHAAVRIVGPLDPDVLRHCFLELLSRHESLRISIVLSGGVPLQKVVPVTIDQVKVVNLSRLQLDDRERLAQRLIGTLLRTPINLTSDPLFEVLVLKMSDAEHILALALDHLISDDVSIRILLRELLQAYVAAVRTVRVHLPEISIQYRDYALWQQRQLPFWNEKNEMFWRRQLAEGQRIRLFPRIPSGHRTLCEFHSFPIRLTERVSAALRSLSRQEATTLAMVVLCTYVALLFRWSNQSTLIVPFIAMGRTRAELDNLVGYFGAPLFLRIELAENDSFLDLLKRVTQTYWEAREHDDLGRIAAQFPAPDFEPNSSFNWIPSDVTSAAQRLTDSLSEACVGSDIRVQPFCIEPLPHSFDWEAEWDREPVAFFTDNGEGIYGEIGWIGNFVSSDAIKTFAKNFESVAEALVRDPTVAVISISCVR